MGRAYWRDKDFADLGIMRCAGPTNAWTLCRWRGPGLEPHPNADPNADLEVTGQPWRVRLWKEEEAERRRGISKILRNAQEIQSI